MFQNGNFNLVKLDLIHLVRQVMVWGPNRCVSHILREQSFCFSVKNKCVNLNDKICIQSAKIITVFFDRLAYFWKSTKCFQWIRSLQSQLHIIAKKIKIRVWERCLLHLLDCPARYDCNRFRESLTNRGGEMCVLECQTTLEPRTRTLAITSRCLNIASTRRCVVCKCVSLSGVNLLPTAWNEKHFHFLRLQTMSDQSTLPPQLASPQC